MHNMCTKLIKTYLPNNKHTHHLFLQKYFSTVIEFTQKIDTFKSCSKRNSDLDHNGIDTEMANNGDKPNRDDLVYQIGECSKRGLNDYGQQLHCYVLRSGFTTDVVVSSAMVNFYCKLDLVKDAHKLFDEIPEPGVVAWNTLISGYVRSGMFRNALSLFLQLESSNLCSNSYSFTAALAACGQLCFVNFGKSIHSRIVKFGVESSTFVVNCLIDMYGKCGYVEYSIELFNEMQSKDTYSWNSVIASSTRNQRLEQAFEFLRRMPNPDTISYNEVINGISQFGNMKQAIGILSTMPNPNSSSWNAIITGFVNRNSPRSAFEFFCKMHSNDIRMCKFTFPIILSGISRLGALKWGTLIHCCVIKFGFDEFVVVGSALIDMYAKCGQINTAEFVFKSLPDKNLFTWNTMISGYAYNEQTPKVFELFKELKKSKDLRPDGVTFLNVLSAKMSLKVAKEYFESMVNEYKIDPTVEHCCCVIKLMGVEGDILGAKGMIERLGFEFCGGVWRALLAACGICGDLEMAKMAAKKVIEIEGDGEFVYVMMSNIYARFGEWEVVRGLRKVMMEKKVIKEAGCSLVEIEDLVQSSSIV